MLKWFKKKTEYGIRINFSERQENKNKTCKVNMATEYKAILEQGLTHWGLVTPVAPFTNMV